MFRPEFSFALDPRNSDMDLQEANTFGSQEHFENALPAADGSMDGWLSSNLPWAGVVANQYVNNFESGPMFQTYRSGPLSSDCGETQPDDSGYGKSIETASVRGDESIPVGSNSNCPDVEQNFNRLQLSQESYHASTPVVYKQNDRLSPPEHADTLVCNICQSQHRNKSELKKHRARHERRYVCDHSTCKKSTVGFASHNDLVRHKRTVHGENLDGPLYVCTHGECAKHTPPKKWPRADNFRSHLKRVHAVQPDLNLCNYRYPNISEDLQGVGTNLQDALVLPTDPLFPNNQHGQPDQFSQFPEAMQFAAGSNIPQYDQEASLDGLSPYMSPGYVDRQRSNSLHLSPTIEQYPQANMEIHVRPASPRHESELDHVMSNGLKTEPPASPPMSQPKLESSSFSAEEESDIELPAATSSPASEIDLDMEKKENDGSLKLLRNCFHDMTSSEQLQFLSSLPKDLLMTALRMRSDSCDPEPLPSDNKFKVRCSKCNKGFNRPCELRKHSKRHDKPYGCTFHSCEKVFGSKNDWKRHEVQQHSTIQTWTCVQNCDERFSSRDGFQSHLRECHRTLTDQVMESLLEDNRQDMESATSFWCGFCRDMVPFPSDRADSRRTVRFDHIDDHFMGRQGHAKLTIAEWLPLEDSPPPRRQSRPRKKRIGGERNVYQSTRSRKRKLSSPPESRPAKQLNTTTA